MLTSKLHVYIGLTLFKKVKQTAVLSTALYFRQNTFWKIEMSKSNTSYYSLSCVYQKHGGRSQNGKHTCINTNLKTFTTPNLRHHSLSILKNLKNTTLFVLSTRNIIPYTHILYLNVYFVYLLCTFFKEIKIKN